MNKTPKYNRGFIAGDRYIKRVSFNKAVLWKNREISLPPFIVEALKKREVKWIAFEDTGKNERWTMSLKRFLEYAQKKTEGQEPQYYINIDYFTKGKINANLPIKPEKKEVDLSETKTKK